jgi:putative ABC transport system substrate-binding protein
MRRREFITLISRTAAAWPLAARAQQPEQLRRIGVLMSVAPNDAISTSWFIAFVQRLEAFGWKERRNVHVEVRWGDRELQSGAAELLALKPDVVVAFSNLAMAAIKPMLGAVPLVFAGVGDPVGSGFVSSLARPGGNITGFLAVEPDLIGKWVELLKEAVPRIKRVLALYMPEISANVAMWRSIEQAAHRLGIEPVAGAVHDRDGIERVISDFSKEPDGGIVAVPNPINNVQRDMLILLEQRYRLPTVHQSADGFLLAYFADMAESMRQAAGYVDRVLKGEKPSDLPVQAPTRYFLTVNLKTAKALGLVIPESFLLRADELIE